MTRIIAVLGFAALCAAVIGVDRVAAAGPQQSRQQVLVQRVAKMKINRTVKLQRADGEKVQGVLVGKTSDTVTIAIYRRRPFRRQQLAATETYALADLRDIKQPMTAAQRAAIVGGVLVGSCAALVATADTEPGVAPEEGADPPAHALRPARR